MHTNPETIEEVRELMGEDSDEIEVWQVISVIDYYNSLLI
jgi:hypothetical protein